MGILVAAVMCVAVVARSLDPSRLHIGGLRGVLNDQVGFISVARNLVEIGRLQSNLMYPSTLSQNRRRTYLYMPGHYVVACILVPNRWRPCAGPGEAILPTTACPSLALAALYAGLTPRFCDVELDTFCLSERTLSPCLTERTRAVVVVYLFGKALDIDPILDACRQRQVLVIEDVAQAFGGRHTGALLGSRADCTVLSFNHVKVLRGSAGGTSRPQRPAFGSRRMTTAHASPCCSPRIATSSRRCTHCADAAFSCPITISPPPTCSATPRLAMRGRSGCGPSTSGWIER